MSQLPSAVGTGLPWAHSPLGADWEFSLKAELEGIYFCTFLIPIHPFIQRSQPSSHKKEKYVKVQRKGRNTATLFGEDAARGALLAALPPRGSSALNEINLQ